MKVIIVGGVAGGASAAARLRRLDENAQITMYERSGYISYANCGLPYYIGGVITDRRQLTLQTPDSFYKRFRVDVKVNHEVLSIDRVNHTVEVKNLSTGEIFTDNYDKLVLSPGAKAVKPPIPGIESERIFTLRTVEDTYRIADEIKALKAADELGLLVTSHCEDLDIIDGGIMNDGVVSRHLGVKGMHRSSEDSITAREIILAETNDCSVHIAHVSTKLSVQLIREAKARGVRVTAETCPHYFSLTEEELLKQDADYRMNPPLREEEDKDAVLEGVLDGTLDCIVTDHAPHTKAEKKDFFTAPNGVVGMETSLAASYTYLVKTGKMSLSDLVRKMSLNPAKILGIPAGTLNVGENADLTIVDLNEEWIVDPEKLHSRSKNAVYKGRTLTGKVKCTLVGGKTVYAEKSIKK